MRKESISNKKLEAKKYDEDKEVLLKEAVDNFRVKYIDMVANHTFKKSIKDLSRIMDFDRSELSRIVNSAENKGKELSFREENGLGTLEDSIIRDISEYEKDSTIKRVFKESVEEGLNFNLKKNTDRFKNIYIKRVVDSSFLALEENYGAEFAGKYAVKVASKKLGINEKTIKNRLHKLDRLSKIIESFSKEIDKDYK